MLERLKNEGSKVGTANNERREVKRGKERCWCGKKKEQGRGGKGNKEKRKTNK